MPVATPSRDVVPKVELNYPYKMALPRVNRLPLRTERERINAEGKAVYGRYFTVLKAQSSSNSPICARFGILLSKKTAKSAVDSNLIRRRTLGIISGVLSSIPVFDYLIIPKNSVLACSSPELMTDLYTLLGK